MARGAAAGRAAGCSGVLSRVCCWLFWCWVLLVSVPLLFLLVAGPCFLCGVAGFSLTLGWWWVGGALQGSGLVAVLVVGGGGWWVVWVVGGYSLQVLLAGGALVGGLTCHARTAAAVHKVGG